MGAKQSTQQLEQLSPTELADILGNIGEDYGRFKQFVVSNGISGKVVVSLSEYELSQICTECGMTGTQQLVLKKIIPFRLEEGKVATTPDDRPENFLLALGYDHVADTLGYRAFPKLSLELPPAAISYLGILSRCSFITFFVLFFYTGFNNATQIQKFLALNHAAGVCNTVPKVWNYPHLLADMNGYWLGSPDFDEVQAVYSLNLFNFEVDTIGYRDFMTEIEIEIQKVGTLAANQTLPENLLWWNSWLHQFHSVSEIRSIEQSLIFEGDVTSMMTKDIIQGTIGSVLGDCALQESTIAYNRATGDFTMEFSYNATMKDPLCGLALNPSVLGYNPLVTGDAFTLVIEVKSLFASLAVAYQVNGPDTLHRFKTITVVATGLFRDVEYSIKSVVDPAFPTMRPMYCLGPTAGPIGDWNCVLKAGNSYGVPFLTDAGSNYSYPTPCNCSLPSGHSAVCDMFNLTFGMIVFDYTRNLSHVGTFPFALRPFVPILEYFYAPPVNSGKATSQFAFYPAWTAIFGQQLPYSKEATWRKQAYKFALSDSFGYGTLVVFATGSTFDFAVSINKYQLKNGACADSFSSPNFQRLVDTPFGALLEVYYQCYATVLNAAISSAGVGASTGGIVSTLLVAVACQFAMMLHARPDDVEEKQEELALRIAARKEEGSLQKAQRRAGSKIYAAPAEGSAEEDEEGGSDGFYTNGYDGGPRTGYDGGPRTAEMKTAQLAGANDWEGRDVMEYCTYSSTPAPPGPPGHYPDARGTTARGPPGLLGSPVHQPPIHKPPVHQPPARGSSVHYPIYRCPPAQSLDTYVGEDD